MRVSWGARVKGRKGGIAQRGESEGNIRKVRGHRGGKVQGQEGARVSGLKT